MVNKRYLGAVEHLGRKAFFERILMNNKFIPKAARVDPALLVEPARQLREFPFGPGDRVQVVAGPHKDKVARIIDRQENTNAFRLDGIKGPLTVFPVEAPGVEENGEHVMHMPVSVDYKNLRLVSTIKHEDGRTEDVAVHSVSLGRRVFDSFSNRYVRERFATHDPSIVVPWPAQKPEKVAEEKASFATAPEHVDRRTYYPASLHDAPLPVYAVAQVTNIHNKYKRHRYAPRITPEDLARTAAPRMPTPPKTRELLQKLQEMPRPPPVEFTPEVEEFLGERIKAGLLRRKQQERENWKQYT